MNKHQRTHLSPLAARHRIFVGILFANLKGSRFHYWWGHISVQYHHKRHRLRWLLRHASCHPFHPENSIFRLQFFFLRLLFFYLRLQFFFQFFVFWNERWTLKMKFYFLRFRFGSFFGTNFWFTRSSGFWDDFGRFWEEEYIWNILKIFWKYLYRNL